MFKNIYFTYLHKNNNESKKRFHVNRRIVNRVKTAYKKYHVN